MTATALKPTSSVAPTVADVIWFIARGDILKGPYTTEQVESAVRSKEISYMDFCWKQGFKEWRPLSSVSEFERRETLRRLPTYPSVKVPASGEAHSDATSFKPANGKFNLPPRKEQNFKISFAKSPRQAISMYEWALAIIFGIGLAYFCTQFALNEVRKGVLARLEVSLLGREEVIGSSKHAVMPETWQPLFSAPEYQELAKQQAFRSPSSYAPRLDLALSVKVSGHATVDKNNQMWVGGYKIENSADVPVWNPASLDLDPVYSRPVVLKGYLSNDDRTSVHVRRNGEPFLDVLNR